MSQWWQILTRRKQLDPATVQDTQLARVLNTFDLTALGVGSTLGVGVYVLAGQVAKEDAGPSVIISFLIAALASMFAGLCYAEFGARVPRAGSAYIYSYVTVGEFIAFIIGWNLILEYVIGSASVARGFTMYLDSLLNNTLNNTFSEITPMPASTYTSGYFDLFSFSITLLLGVALSFGLKESKWVNNIFTLINVAVVLFVIIAGAFHANIENWHLGRKNDADKGGFMPFGFRGTIKGAATCFYGFVGFDCIATTGEEVKNPKRAIPISIIVSLFIIFLAYFGTSTVLTLMVPYYDQDLNAPLPHAFDVVQLSYGKWIVAIGGMFGLIASLFGAMFPLPRIIYAMASDMLIFKFLGNINRKFKTPVVGTLIAALLTGLMAAMFELKQLVNMMSIGTLLAYTLVAACVLLLRYSDYTETSFNGYDAEYSNLISSRSQTFKAVMKQIFNFKRRSPNHLTSKIITAQVIIFCVLSLAFGACWKFLHVELMDKTIWAVSLTCVILFLMLLTLFSISTQPTSNRELSFKVPWVPLIPALSICVNIYLMLMLDVKTWIRFGVWMAVGFTMYCCYGLPNSLRSYQRLE